jgi:hypothetical protein
MKVQLITVTMTGIMSLLGKEKDGHPKPSTER